MVNAICIILPLVFMGIATFYTDSKSDTGFFDIGSTTCMRGLWCIVILLVHIPSDYQNFIQDMIGSFAYIGVTFFFMTSSYGLVLAAKNKPEKVIKGFWKRRLPKLLVPMVLVNVARVFAKLYADKEFLPLQFLGITGFVKQLLFFYLVFWIIFKILPKKTSWNLKCSILCVCVIVFSITIYFLDIGWPVESFGFIYGVILANAKEVFLAKTKNKWLLKSGLLCAASLILGITYLKFKEVVFAGDYLIKLALGFAILLFILFLTAKLKFGNKISHFLGEISYEIYLIHDVVFIILAAVYPQMDSGIFIVLSVVISVITSVIINKLSKIILGLGRKSGIMG